MVLGIAIAAIQIYLFLIGLRILLSWIGIHHPGMTFLNRIVDPYLRLFQGIRFLRTAYLDLTPIAAALVLQALIYVLFSLRSYGGLPRAGDLIFFVVGLIWSFLSFLLILFFLLTSIRLLAFSFPSLSQLPLWHALDMLLMKPVLKIGMFIRRGFLSYRTGLILLALICLALYITGEWLIRWLAYIL